MLSGGSRGCCNLTRPPLQHWLYRGRRLRGEALRRSSYQKRALQYSHTSLQLPISKYMGEMDDPSDKCGWREVDEDDV
ncbi:hypothetical protein HanRHA438_Chr06g0283401 [Helianthus annuus]|nr:hypothetical protein HanRHA438_Chr06g0283401 [Helianthus annuus]